LTRPLAFLCTDGCIGYPADMIVRYALKCETCEHPHTVRIGLGQDSSQTHKFPCRGCGEEIVVRVDLDQLNAGYRIVCIENCEPIVEVQSASIVYVDPNFPIPPHEQGKDRIFPRLGPMHAM
jgi:hypothetical protein